MPLRNDSSFQLTFSRQLTPRVLERALYGLRDLFASRIDLSHASLLIEMSSLEFADFSALAQVALIVEWAARHRVRVDIVLPALHLRRVEHFGTVAAQRRFVAPRLDARKACRSFLEHTGFINAVRVEHVPDSQRLVRFLDSPDKGSPSGNVSEQAAIEPSEQTALLRHIYRLRWLKPLNQAGFSASAAYASFVLASRHRGMSTADAKAIAHTLLAELVENVHQHAPERTGSVSCEPHALVGALVLNPSKYRLSVLHYREVLQPFINGLQRLESPIIRIIVGDSGRGVPDALGPFFKRANESEIPQLDNCSINAKVLFWSFNPWSTSDHTVSRIERGTRGLWQVQRFVRVYGGSIIARSADTCVGWVHQDLEEDRPVREDKLPFVPGTMLDTFLLPSHLPMTCPRP